jgi:hypothetical protein
MGSVVVHAESEPSIEQARRAATRSAAPYSPSLSASDCSDLLSSDPLAGASIRAQVGTITRSEQSALFRCRNNAESGRVGSDFSTSGCAGFVSVDVRSDVAVRAHGVSASCSPGVERASHVLPERRDGALMGCSAARGPAPTRRPSVRTTPLGGRPGGLGPASSFAEPIPGENVASMRRCSPRAGQGA